MPPITRDPTVLVGTKVERKQDVLVAFQVLGWTFREVR